MVKKLHMYTDDQRLLCFYFMEVEGTLEQLNLYRKIWIPTYVNIKTPRLTLTSPPPPTQENYMPANKFYWLSIIISRVGRIFFSLNTRSRLRPAIFKRLHGETHSSVTTSLVCIQNLYTKHIKINQSGNRKKWSYHSSPLKSNWLWNIQWAPISKVQQDFFLQFFFCYTTIIE